MHAMRGCLLIGLFTFVPIVAQSALTAEEQKILTAADGLMNTFPTDLERAVQINSATDELEGVRKVAHLFETMLSASDFSSRFIEMPKEMRRAGHLVAEFKGNRGKRLLLIGHLDTVLAGGNFRKDGVKAYGSGTNDIKGGDLVMLYALRALHDAGLMAGAQIIVVMTGDEEAVGQPVEIARGPLWEAAKRSEAALAFETAIGNTGTVARRGSISWEIEVQGATGHSSGIFSPAMGAGSVYEASRILQGFYNEMRELDGLTLNPALIVGGTQAELDRTHGSVTGKTNITAQRTLIHGDLRTMNAEQLEKAQAKMRAIVERHLPRTSAKISFNEGYPAMQETSANHELLAQLDSVSRDLGFGAITAYDPKARGAGDVAFVSPPLPALDGLGLRGGGAHAENEWADLESAPELVKRTALLIYRLTR